MTSLTISWGHLHNWIEYFIYVFLFISFPIINIYMLNVINDFCSVFRAVLMQCGATIILIFNIIICATVGEKHIDFFQTNTWCSFVSKRVVSLVTDTTKPPSHSYHHPLPDIIEYRSCSYRVVSGNISWYEAMQMCIENDSDLVSITDAYHQAFLTVLVNRLAVPHWIGLYSQDVCVFIQLMTYSYSHIRFRLMPRVLLCLLWVQLENVIEYSFGYFGYIFMLLYCDCSVLYWKWFHLFSEDHPS